MSRLVFVSVIMFFLASCSGVSGQLDHGEPQEAPLPVALDDALARDINPPNDDDLEELAQSYRLEDPPQDAKFERYITPEEYAAVMIPCLQEQGIEARARSDGGIDFGDIPIEQGKAQAEAMYRCDVQFPTHPLFAVPLDPDQLTILYRYLVDDLTPCLVDLGFDVPPAPSVDAFIESYSEPSIPVWSPYPVDDPRLEQPDEWEAVNEACPQVPPLASLYGG